MVKELWSHKSKIRFCNILKWEVCVNVKMLILFEIYSIELRVLSNNLTVKFLLAVSWNQKWTSMAVGKHSYFILQTAHVPEADIIFSSWKWLELYQYKGISYCLAVFHRCLCLFVLNTSLCCVFSFLITVVVLQIKRHFNVIIW